MSGSRSFSNNSLSLVHSFHKQFEENRLWRGLVWASGLSLFVVIQVGAFTLFLSSAPTSADKRVHCPSVPSVNRKAVGGNWMRHLVAPTSFVLAPHPSCNREKIPSRFLSYISRISEHENINLVHMYICIYVIMYYAKYKYNYVLTNNYAFSCVYRPVDTFI
jgi:hypothetical protein